MKNNVLIPLIVDRNWRRTERVVLDGKGMEEKEVGAGKERRRRMGRKDYGNKTSER